MTHALDLACDPSSVWRDAARELTPVIVDLGPDQASFASFVSAVEEDRKLLVLEPIAAEALPAELQRPLRITPAASGAHWSLSATSIRADGPRRALVDLEHARMLANPDCDAVAVQASDLLVLVIPGGLHGGAAYVFPVQRVGTDMCEIRSSSALEPGRQLECVELVGDRRLLRRASAQVLESRPCYMADGGRSFSCRLSLSDEIAADPDTAHDLVTDASEVRRLLDLAGMMHVSGWFEAPGWGRGPLRLLEVTKDDLGFELASPPARGFPVRGLRVGLELFATAYELDVRPLACAGDRLRASLPLILRRRRRHRREQRVAVGPALRAELAFRNPVSGAVESHPVLEASFFALSFELTPQHSVLWRGLPLEQAQLTWSDRIVHLGDLSVEEYGHDRASGRMQCVASIQRSSIADDPDMISLMATLAHPRVLGHDGADFSALHQTYLKAGLFGPHMHRNLGPMMDSIQEVWRKAHREAAEVVRTFVHGPVDAPDAAVTVMRAWEHGWVAQHFVDTSPDLNGATGKLQSAYLDHLVPRPDGRYLLFFVKTDNRVMNAYLTRFFRSTGTPDAVSRSVVELWSRPPEAPGLAACAGDIEVRPCSAQDEMLIARAAQRCLGEYAAGALSMMPGELPLPDTQARFARAGLERSRSCDIVAHGSSPAYAVLEERSTPGLNLTWMLNACWILPLHTEHDRGGFAFDAALRSAVQRPAQTATGERFLNLPAGLDAERLSAWGFKQEAAVYLYVLTRAGLHRFFSYAMSRYGEIDALTMRRERRRSLPRSE